LIHDRQPAVSGEESRKSLEIVNAFIESGFTGKPVNFPLDPDRYEEILKELSEAEHILKP